MTRRTLVVLIAILLVVIPLSAAPPTPRPIPKLVVILVVDQMRADYIEKFGQHWTGGLRRLLDEGAWFREAAYPYMTTVTCVGHSTIVTGSFPNTHGIVSNQWWDRATGKPVNCVADAAETLVSYGAPAKGGTSTRNLLVPALPDELRVQLPVPPRIVSMSVKDYTATTMAGRRADVAVWFNAAARSLASSSFFGAAPVPFVAEFVKAHPVEAEFGKAWRKLLPDSDYLYADDAPGENPPAGNASTFPHVLRGAGDTIDADFYTAWVESPFSDVFLGQLAETSIDRLKLGRGRGTDYLAVSFSALDFVGHRYGPRSHEVQDVLARLDQTIWSLLAHLDRSVGRANYVLALTADHGVAPIPEQIAAAGLSAGRIPTADLVARVERALEPMLGAGKHVAHMVYNDLYFEPGVFERLQANPAAMRAAMDAVRSMPGVARVFRSDELDHPFASAEDRIERAALATFLPGRSGDFIIVPQPYWIVGAGSKGTTHGTPYGYDLRVPLFLLGKGIRKGQFLTPAAPVDIAPTLAFLCGITLPAADGRVLGEALLPVPAPGQAPSAPRKQ
ncbi:MAG TPA: alkaline phosphatase family protein [Vicinamibacterales bacterium]|jgi:predicted AlkP superfamily pyrophosphatase or phosphodiesterase